MNSIWQGLVEAIRLIFIGDPALREIAWLSLRVSGVALFFSTCIGVPLGALMGLNRFFGRRLAIALLYTGMGFPPVTIGLFVYLLLSRNGVLGSLAWSLVPSLFTPAAMVIAQCIISFPIVAGFTMAAVMGVNPQLRHQVRSLGATSIQTTLAVLRRSARRSGRVYRCRLWQHHLGGGRGDDGGGEH